MENIGIIYSNYNMELYEGNRITAVLPMKPENIMRSGSMVAPGNMPNMYTIKHVRISEGGYLPLR